MRFHLRIHFSSHCVSEELKGGLPSGACIMKDHRHTRVFNEDRYAWSLELPQIVDNLMKKPTFQIRETLEENHTLFCLHMKHPLPAKEKYYVFLRLRHRSVLKDASNEHKMHLQLESAYSRELPPLSPKHPSNPMFGRLAEELSLGKN